MLASGSAILHEPAEVEDLLAAIQARISHAARNRVDGYAEQAIGSRASSS